MKPKVSIVVLVDAVGALSERTLHNGNLSMVDDSILENPLGSRNRGTPDLVTVVRPGQVVQWTPIAVDVQTPVEILDVSFLAAPAAPPQAAPAQQPGYAAQPTYTAQPAPMAQSAYTAQPSYAAQGALTSGQDGGTAVQEALTSGAANGDGTAPIGPDATASNGFQNPDLLTWEGFVPFHMAPGVPYRYRLTLQIHDGANSVLSIDSPALLRG